MDLLSLREFAARTGRNYYACWHLVQEGRVMASRDERGRWRIPMAEVERLRKTASEPVPA